MYIVRGQSATKSVEAESNTVEITVEKHTFGTSWKSDADNHWHECDVCGDKADIAAHDYEWVTDKEATETAAGSRHEQCTICGYAKAAVEIPATGDSEEPDTGDSANIAVWALLCGVSAIGAYVTTRARKEKTK